MPDALRRAVRRALVDAVPPQDWTEAHQAALDRIAASGDPRLAWLIADRLRFVWQPELYAPLADAAAALLGAEAPPGNGRHAILNRLIAWDVPAYPGYLPDKRAVLTRYVPGLEPILVPGDIDWQLVDWGGVRIDARPYGATDALCDLCIPAADDPPVSSAAEATWLGDTDIVFGIVVNGQARAYPRRIMEVREMVNDSLGGRHLGIPYCTLCGAAQAYFTDAVPVGVKRPILRTSGLLIRSNKVMYDVESLSVFDTFRGRAVTGPLAALGVVLPQATVITAEWGDWKAAYPDTTVLVEALALGRDFDLRNTRDKNGPIFPVGDVDPRLPVHEDVIGIVIAEGAPVAFQRSAAMLALRAGEEVAVGNVRLALDGGGIKAADAGGASLASHQAFWFAWSQFHPGTALWPE